MCDNYEQRNKTNSMKVLMWSFLWALSLVIASAAAQFLYPLNYYVLGLLIVAHLFFAFGALRAHQVWLKQLDEFQRSVQLQSMAFTLGITWIVVILLLLLNSIGLIEINKSHITTLAVIMAITGSVTTIIRTRQTS